MKKIKYKHYYFFILLNIAFIEINATNHQSIKILLTEESSDNETIPIGPGNTPTEVSPCSLDEQQTYSSSDEYKTYLTEKNSPTELEKKYNKWYYEIIFNGFEEWTGELYLKDTMNHIFLMTKVEKTKTQQTSLQEKNRIFPVHIELKNLNTQEEYFIYGEINIADGFNTCINSSIKNENMKLRITPTKNCSLIYPTINIEGKEFRSQWKENEDIKSTSSNN